MDVALQHKLLAPLASTACAGQRIIIKGDICNAREVEQLKQLMSPTLVWIQFRLFSELSTMMIAKDIADACVEHDELGFVLELYELVVEHGVHIMGDDFSISWALQHCSKFVELLEMIVLELMINIACSKLKMRDVDGCVTWCERAGSMLGRMFDRLPNWIPPAGIIAYYHIVSVWSQLYREGGTSKSELLVKTVGEEVSQLERIKTFPHHAHDLAILKNHPNQQATLSADALRFPRCSISQLPFPATSFYKTVKSLKPYTQSKGWHDLPCPGTLDEKARTRIHVLQRQHGLQVTDFDLLYFDFDQGKKIMRSWQTSLFRV